MERSPSHPESPTHDGQWNVRTLKEYFERVITDRDVSLKLMIDDRDRALRLAVVELERRLDNLNHAHEQAKEKERDFYSRAQHDDFAVSLNQQLNQIRTEVESLRRPQWSTWIAASMLMITIVGALWYFATQPLNLEIQHQRDKDAQLTEQLRSMEKSAQDRSDQRAKASEDRDATINMRINKLYELYEQLQQQHVEALKRK